MSPEGNGESAMLESLLELQAHDTAADRLRHRLETLPERAALEQAERSLAEVNVRRDEMRSRRDDAAREEQRFDDEAKSLEERAVEVEARMYSGEVASPRELQAMQADVHQLRRQRQGVEEREIAVMEQREALDGELARLDAGAGDLENEAEKAREALRQEEAGIDADLRVEIEARQALAGRVSPELLADYEACRARARGIGAARLVGGACQGCHLSIPSTEAERIRKSGSIGHCENCGCILVP